MTTGNNTYDICITCSKKVFLHMSAFTCFNCKLKYHRKCICLKQDEILVTKWYCINCIEEVFPFTNLEDSDFIKELHAKTKMSYVNLMDKVFDPFTVNETMHDILLNDVDPDINYFNTTNLISNVKCCDYYTEDDFNKKCTNILSKYNMFSLIHLNIRSARKNLGTFENYLQNLDHKFSFIGLSETWFTDDTVDNYGLLGYNLENIVRYNSRGGGVSILIKLGIQYSVRQDLCVNDNLFQALFIEIHKDIFHSEKNIILGNVYRPPNTDISEFNNRLNYLLGKIRDENKLLYIMGDFNINLLNESTHIETSQFLDSLYSDSIFPLITRPTRVCQTNATLIDNIFCNDLEFNTFFNGVFFTDISDHFPIFCIKINLCHTSSVSHIKIRNLSHNNMSKFDEKLCSVNWNNICNINEANEAFETFYSKFNEIYNECFPIVTLKSKYKTRKLWLTDGLKCSIKIKNKLYIKSKRNPSNQNIDEYKVYKNKLNRLLKLAERNHYSQVLNDNRNDLKKSWKIIKEVINKAKNNTLPNKFKISDKFITDSKIISDSFNSYFTNIGKNLASKIPNSNLNPLHYIESTNEKTMVMYEASEDEIINVIKLLKQSAPGPDGIHSKIIKSSYAKFIKPLKHTLNLSLSQGIFPKELKIAHVTPVYKSGDKFSINNYRPISLLSVFSKILEKLMYNRLLKFINKWKILYEFQFGFRENYGTSLALIYLVDKLCQALSNGDYIIGVCIDLTKAFDTVNHEILFDKLYKYGIRGVAMKWIRSYLNERSQCVNYNNEISYKSTISCGVPQGSILGPLLFLIYVNDLAKVSKLLFFIMFADDTNIFITGKNLRSMIDTLNGELTQITEWLNANKISLNISKTQFMVVSGSKAISKTLSDVIINDHKIDMVNCVKFLGVYIDNKLSWSQHITYIKSKISKAIGIICKARKSLDKTVLITLYYSFVHSYFTYGIDIWGNAHKKYLDSIFLLQKKVMRIIKCVGPRDSTDQIFKDFKVLKLSQLYNVSVAIFMYKFVKGNLPEIFYSMYTVNGNIHRYNTRRAHYFTIPYCRLQISQQQIRYTGVKVWNYLISRKFDYNCSLHVFRKNVKLLFHLIEDIS